MFVFDINAPATSLACAKLFLSKSRPRQASLDFFNEKQNKQKTEANLTRKIVCVRKKKRLRQASHAKTRTPAAMHTQKKTPVAMHTRKSMFYQHADFNASVMRVQMSKVSLRNFLAALSLMRTHTTARCLMQFSWQ